MAGFGNFGQHKAREDPAACYQMLWFLRRSQRPAKVSLTSLRARRSIQPPVSEC